MDQAIQQQPTAGKSTGKKIILISFGVLAVVCIRGSQVTNPVNALFVEWI